MWYTTFEAMMSYKYSEIHKKVADEITKLYKDRHNIDIFKILFQYDDTMKMLDGYEGKQVYPTEKSKIIQLFIFFTTNKQYHKERVSIILLILIINFLTAFLIRLHLNGNMI